MKEKDSSLRKRQKSVPGVKDSSFRRQNTVHSVKDPSLRREKSALSVKESSHKRDKTPPPLKEDSPKRHRKKSQTGAKSTKNEMRPMHLSLDNIQLMPEIDISVNESLSASTNNLKLLIDNKKKGS